MVNIIVEREREEREIVCLVSCGFLLFRLNSFFSLISVDIEIK